MTVTLNLSPQLEESVRKQAAESGLDVEAFLIEALESQVKVHQAKTREKKITTAEEFDALMDEITSLLPPVEGHVDDSRESIYD